MAEKEVLLKELHHRVKNNLQFVASLLSLQSGYVEDGAFLEILKDCQSRVAAMALLHEHLYGSGDIAGLDFGEYVNALSEEIFYSYGAHHRAISLRLTAEKVSIPAEMVIPCGLIINELVSNSLKHGFPGYRGGEVAVSVQQKDRQTIRIIVEDNGVGIPPPENGNHPDSLGLRLVSLLAGQLDAAIKSDFGGTGARFIVDVPIPEPETRIPVGPVQPLTAAGTDEAPPVSFGGISLSGGTASGT